MTGIVVSKNIHSGFFWLASVLAFIVPAASVNYPQAFYYAALSLILLSLFSFIVRTDPQPLSKLEKVMICTWLLYPAIVALDLWLRAGWIWPLFQQSSRFMLVVPIFLMVRRFGISLNALKWGFFIGAVVVGFWALYQKLILGVYRVHGGTSTLVEAFGDISLLLGVISVALFQPNWSKDWRWGFVALVSLSLGVFASLASGTKGGWISVPILCWVMVSLVRHPSYTKRFIVLSGMLTSAVLIWYFSPFIQARVGNIPLAIASYFETGEVAAGSAGIRLALWHAGTLIFIDNPLLGVGTGNFHTAKLPYVEAGLLSPGILHLAVHSQFFNALVELGIVGPILVFSIYGVFIMHCRTYMLENKSLATAGVLLVVAFMDFGLVEVIWGINNTGVFFTVLMALIAGQLSYEGHSRPTAN